MGGLTLVTQQGGERFESLDKAYTDYTRGNYAKSYEIFDYYAKNNNLHAVLATGYFLFMGYGVEQDYVKAKSYLDRAGKSGFARAFYLLGLLEKNKAKTQQFSLVAERLLNKAADMGDPVATNALANQYYQRGDLNKAISWNEKAIQLGSRAAKRNQQVISSGSNTKVISVPSANNDALAQLRKSSAEGNAQASYELATRYHKGVGVNVNFGEAIRLYRVAAGQGSDAARKILPVLLSKQSSTGGINSMWMQQTSNMIAMPPVILADKENKG
ncbi:MAG TPA: hypothetical protein DD638_12330, partial [Pasteurellaceae bacterium]|nr:hypothetical protein [Pasteurellaceae bacterium]